MVKKAIYHLKRAPLYLVELTGLVVVVLLAAWLALMWRLYQGPLPVDFLTARVEKSFAEYQTGFAFDIASTQLVWGGRMEPFAIEMRDVSVTRDDGTPLVVVSRAEIQISKRGLMLGKIVPKVVRVYGPELRLVRNSDGHFSLNLASPQPQAAPAPDTTQPTQSIVANLMEQMKSPEMMGLIGGLREVRVDEAVVTYEDHILDVEWQARKADILLVRKGDGMVADSIVEADMGGDTPALVRLHLSHAWETAATKAVIYYSGVDPAVIAQQSPQLSPLSDLHLALKGSLEFQLDERLVPGDIRFVAAADPGTVNAGGLYPEALPIQGLYAVGVVDPMRLTGGLDLLKINFGGPTLEAQVTVEAPEEAPDSRRVLLAGELLDMPLDDLHRYWPEKLATDAQRWVTQHLSQGIADKATIEAAFVVPLGQPAIETSAPVENETLEGEAAQAASAPPTPAVTVEKLGGRIDFQGITVDYFPPLMAVKDVKGHALYDQDSFNLALDGGTLGDMKVSTSAIHITNLRHAASADNHANIDIAVSLSGPVRTALQVIDSKPLQYPSKLGLKVGDVRGGADVDVTFKFPLHKALALEEVAVTADARITDAYLPDVVAGYALSGGPMQLTLAKGALRVKGAGALGAMPLTFDWLKNFTAGSAASMTLKADVPLDAEALLRFGVPADLNPQGRMPSQIDYTLRPDGTARLDLKGDLKGLGFSWPAVNAGKQATDDGSLAMTLDLKNNMLQRISGLDLTTAGLNAAGNVDFRQREGRTEVSAARFSSLRFGGSDVALDLTAGSGYEARIQGRVLDVSPFMKQDGAANSDEEAARPGIPLRLHVNVDRLVTGEQKGLERVALFLDRSQFKRIEQLQLKAQSGGGPLTVDYMPVNGGHSLKVDAGNAGAALSALGVTSAVQGGRLLIDAQPKAGAGPRDLTGTIILTDFALRNVPVLAKLLNAMSLSGIIDLLNNKGINFKKARARFDWTDRGQPQQVQNMRLITISEGQTSGASLGLTFEGVIDNWKGFYDLNGTIIPVSDLNKLLGIIPVLGDVLTAGGEGIIAATYKVKGPKGDPEVSVNPLAALAPGILRKLFFEN